MQIFKSFLLFGLFLFFNNQFAICIKRDAAIANGFLTSGVSFAPGALQPLLLFSLQILLFDEMFVDSSLENTENILKHITDSTERLEKVMMEQHERLFQRFEDYSDKTRIVENAMKKLSNIGNYFVDDFVPCVMKKKCIKSVRNSHVNDLMYSGSHRRVEYSELIENYIIRYNSGDTDNRLFDVILQKAEYQMKWNEDCNNTQSVQDLIYHYYNHITRGTLWMYSMISYAYLVKLKASAEKEAQAKLIESMHILSQKFRKQAHMITNAARDALVKAPRDIRPCDPYRHARLRSWDRLHNFIQAFVISGYYLRGQKYKKTCFNGEATYIDRELAEQHHIPAHLLTQEKVFNCMKFDVDSLFVDSTDNERIYHHLLAYKNLVDRKFYGKYDSNSSNVVWERSDVLWPPQVFPSAGLAGNPIGQNYPVCLCQIDQIHHKNTLRRFNLGPIHASIGSVVIGIRWAKTGNRIYLKIQEGRLINGSVDPFSVHWQTRKPNSFYDDVMDVNYRSVSLDDVILPAGSFVTGVQLQRSRLKRSDGELDTLTLSVWGSTIDESGNLNLGMTLYHADNRTIREEIMLNDLDAPENDQKNNINVLVREPGKYFVKFQPTSMEKDAGQTTIPYLDIQQVVTRPATPISGIGLYYKRSRGFGGYIGLKLISVDIRSIINDKKLNQVFIDLENTIIKKMKNNNRKSRKSQAIS